MSQLNPPMWRPDNLCWLLACFQAGNDQPSQRQLSVGYKSLQKQVAYRLKLGMDATTQQSELNEAKLILGIDK